MTPEEAKRIQDKIEKNSKVILKNLAKIRKNKSNINFISGKTGKDIEAETNLSPEEINAAVEYMKVKNWINTIQQTNHNPQYKFMTVEITDEGRELVKEWNAEQK